MSWGSAMRVKRWGAPAFLLVLGALGVWFLSGTLRVEVDAVRFQESSRPLENPNRGFYAMFSYRITDQRTDYETAVSQALDEGGGVSLCQLLINLQEYRDRDISSQGLANLDALLTAWEKRGKSLILRFLYDWDGENRAAEPDTLDRVLGHVGQMEEILREHSPSIFTLQGLFVGSWGEMHDTAFGTREDFQLLAEKLAEAAAPDTFLAVRTPAQWRGITGQGTPSPLTGLAARLGLFNDGMLGSETDWGTYSSGGQAQGKRTRQQELDFQRALCLQVPNGGEVIADNPYNDFDAALRDLETMRVTYLNRDYDRAVLDKWAQTTVSDGCYTGLSGLEYIERRLGYRLLLTENHLKYHFLRRSLHIRLEAANTGFAPIYREPRAALRLLGREDGTTVEYTLSSQLAGRVGREDPAAYDFTLPLKGLDKGRYALYFSLEDPLTAQPVYLANRQDREELGYKIADLEIR